MRQSQCYSSSYVYFERLTRISNNDIQPVRNLLHLLCSRLVAVRIIHNELDNVKVVRVLLGELVQMGGL